jgi:hypothetical protein
MNGRRFAWLGFGGLATIVGGCQLVSGLSGYQESGATTGGVSATGTGGSSGTTGVTATGVGGAGSSTGGAGGCAPKSDTCGGPICLDLKTDPLNCGACGRSCADSLAATPSCQQGQCAPVPFGGVNKTVTAISATDEAVCWAGVESGASTEIQVRLAAGWAAIHPGLPVTGSIGGLAVLDDGKSVLYSHSTFTSWEVDQWTFSNAASTTVTLSSTTLIAGGAVVAPGDGNFYWAGRTIDSQWHFYGTPLTSMPNKALIDHATNTASLPIATAPGNDVYWPYAPHFDRASTGGAVGGNLYENTPQKEPQFLAIDPDKSGYLYWIGLVGASEPSTLSRILKSASDQSIPDVLSFPVAKATGLVADDSHVYWLEGGTCPNATGKLMKLAWDGVPETVVDNLVCPDNLALGGNYLYYSTGLIGGMQIYRVVK